MGWIREWPGGGPIVGFDATDESTVVEDEDGRYNRVTVEPQADLPCNSGWKEAEKADIFRILSSEENITLDYFLDGKEKWFSGSMSPVRNKIFQYYSATVMLMEPRIAKDATGKSDEWLIGRLMWLYDL